MSLSELGGKLEIGGAGDALLGGLTGALSTLRDTDTLSVDVSASTDTAAPGDPEELSLSLEVSTTSVHQVVGSLPDPTAAVAPLSGALDLVLGAEGDEEDLPTRLRALLERLGQDLDEAQEIGFLAVLERLGGTLGEAPEARSLNALLASLLEAAGAGVNPSAFLGEAVPALTGTVRGLGAAMALESTLAEGERLARIMSTQLDAERVGMELDALRNATEVGSFSLDRLREAGGAPSPMLLDDALEAARNLSVRLGGVQDLLARSMGFGEATLVQMDPALLTGRVQAASDVLAAVDTDRVERALQRLMDPLRPVLEQELLPPPAAGLDELLTLLETHASDIAAALGNAEVERLAEPLTAGFDQVNGVLRDVSGAIEEVVSTIRGALEEVRQAVAALPLDEIAARIRAILDPVRQAMEAATALVQDVQDALATVAATVTDGLEDAEAVVLTFKTTVDAALDEAADFVESLNLDEVVGRVGDEVRAFAETLGKAEVKPYFDTAVSGIETTADVVDAVPLELLPEDMKADLDAAIAPVRAIDVPASMAEVKGWFQIQEDGTFALRAPLEEAVADIAAQHALLVEEVAQADPRQLIPGMDAAFADLRAEVDRIVPQLSLAPVEEAIAEVKSLLGDLDVRAQLQPVEDAFAEILDAVDRYSPEQLIAPLEARVDEARTRLTELLGMDDWLGTLDRVEAEVAGLLDRADPRRLEEVVSGALGEATRLLDTVDRLPLERAFGDFISALLRGSGLGAREWSVDALGRWLRGDSGAEDLVRRAGAIHDAVRATRDAVAGVDLDALRRDLSATVADFRGLVAALPAGAQRDEVLRVLDGVRPEPALAALEANRARYLAALDQAVGDADLLARRGLSQVDVTLERLQRALDPAAALRRVVTETLGLLGIDGLENGLTGPLRDALAVATPERVVGIVVPVAQAIRDRLTAVLAALLAPVRDGITELQGLVAALDLTPLREGVAAVVEELKTEIAALSPMSILGPTVDSWDGLRAELEAFDPLAPVRAVVDALTGAADRLLDLLDAEELLEHPIRIYDEIAGVLAALSVERLLSPVLDQLDNLAAQVGEGIDDTSAALVALQDALPAPGGGSSVSVSVSAA